MSIDSAVSIAWDVLKCIVVPIKRQFEYITSSKRYVRDLQKEVGKLAYEAERVHNDIEEAKNNLRNVYGQVMEWQASAEKALKEAQDLLRDFEMASKTCCYRTLPNPNCRYQFSRKAEDKIEDIKQLAQECSEFKAISFSGPAPGNVTAPTPARKEGKDVVPSIKLRDDVIFESRALVIRDIMDALANNSNSVVGVYGMGGVGKSTLLVDVERRIREEKSFDLVAKADVSENPDFKRIQGEIAHALGLDIKSEEYVSVRAERLHMRLENEERTKKKVLIILDNLWKGLDLKLVGVPCRHDNKVVGCKLLLTSRNRDVLRREMGCDRDFLLGGLQEEEAKKLFEKIVGDKAHADEFKPLVDEALHKCAGVPFLILAIAKRFKDASLSEWKDTLKQITMSKDKGINVVINKMLHLSFEDLEEEVKLTLRLCVIYGVSEPSLENLVRYGVGLGLYGEDSSMEEARNRLSSLIRTLQASSLLLESRDGDGFKIHDLVREFVASVASRDQPLLVLKDKDKFETKLPDRRAICFPYVDMKEFPKELDCPELQIFLLFTNNESLNILDSLFNSMRKLMVLSLTGIRLTCSPSLFQSLENLHTLCLDVCKLDDAAPLVKLKGLKILSFVNSNIQRLPKEIGQLVELRLLDLNYCSQLQVVEPGVLGSLIKLEELYFEKSFNEWNSVKETPPTNASLIELNHMKNLCTLHVSIPDPSMLSEDLNFEKLTKYVIQIGNAGRWSEYKGLRTLELKLDPMSDVLRKGCIQSILGKTDDLFLDGLNEIEQSICALSQQGFPKLKHLQVENSPSAHYILQSPSHTNFKMLESLLLKNLINLEKICNNNISSKSFSALKVVRVKSCDKMEVLFPLSVMRELPLLEKIEVFECELMQGIVESDDCGKFELRNLHVLTLHVLPNIKNFFIAKTAPSSSSSNDQVGTQVAFFNGQRVAFPRLEELKITGLAKTGFMFFPSMVKSFAQLRELTIEQCKETEAIITEEEGLMETSETLAFPMLTYLYLIALESLKCFSRKKCSQEVRSQDCIKSGATALFNQEVAFPRLETLTIFGLGNIEMIWDNQVYFRHLKTLTVSFCCGLSHIFTPTIAGNLMELTKLRIEHCKMLTEVIVDKGGEEGHVVAFKQLKYLKLCELTLLTCFSSSVYTLVFPILEDFIVDGCLNMNFFSKGPIEAPKLEKVQVSHTAWFWKGNLNITIQNMFEGMAKVVGIKKMRLSEFPQLIGKWHGELFPYNYSWPLESLTVDKCPSFINAVPSRLMLVLDKMHKLQVRDCESLEEIFDFEGLEAVESTQVLPRLRELNLVNLPNLRQLWNIDLRGPLCFNFLSDLTLYKCNNLRHAFAPSIAQCRAYLEIKKRGQMEGVIVKEEGQGSAVEKITFPNLHRMKLECLPNLTSFLLGKNHALDCPKLRSMTIAHCPKMRSLTWQSLMENDHSTPSLFTPQVQFPQLESMALSHMDNLSKIWTYYPQGTFTFKHLRKVEAQNCRNLENLFPHWVAISLTQLKELRMESCELKELVVSGDDTPHSTTAQVLFPELTSLVLHDMPQLKSFCHNFPILNWPSLQELRVTHCDKLNMLSFAAPMNKWTQRDDERHLSNQEAYSSFERDFPNLERLLLVDKDVKMIQDGKFLDDIFGKPKALTLACFHDEKAVFPPRFLLERFQNLKSLEIFCSSFEDIFPNEGFDDKGKHPVLENLRELKLSNLYNLKHVWREDYLVATILQSIKTFEVWDCPNLTTLFPAVTSFQNLTKLVVKNFYGTHLVTFSKVTNLVHLTIMTIIGCERMKEVVTDDENGEEKVISFGKLVKLTLQHLPSLVCFSSTPNCIFRFSSLRYVEVEECPKMKSFSNGTLSTPKLRGVKLFSYLWDWDWEGDLNATIKSY